MSEQSQKRKCLAVVRVRGVSDVYLEIKETMELLHLPRNCHATLLDDRPAYVGMLKKAQHFLTWGEVSKESIALLLKERGRLVGNKKLTDEYAKELGYKSLVLNYNRTSSGLRACIKEFIEGSTRYPSKAKDLANRMEFLTSHIPDLRVIITAESNGTAMADSAMSMLRGTPGFTASRRALLSGISRLH